MYNYYDAQLLAEIIYNNLNNDDETAVSTLFL
jgi:hypothetical protein